MFEQFLRKVKRSGRRAYKDINPEDIFIDSANLPGYDEFALEGRIEQPIGRWTFFGVRFVFFAIALCLVARLWTLSVHQGTVYAEISENNRLRHTVIFANRGVIVDRNGVELAGNAVRRENDDFPARIYSSHEGLSHIVGFVKYPSRDSKGFYYDEEYRGRDGVELSYNDRLRGVNGLKLKETDVHGELISESVVEPPVDGERISLSLDASLTDILYKSIKFLATDHGFVGGAGVIMDVETGEILAMTSYPQYDQNLLTDGREKSLISSLLSDSSKPFLNRAIGGLYTPGSIIKPELALAALNEGIISPSKEIHSSGSITVPNPYDPSKPSIFRDWKAHGFTDMKEALAVSSDVYFYSIGGGYGDQKGLGIEKIDRYLQLFGINEKTDINLKGETSGFVPTPEWKEKTYNDIWRLGDTYITSIGQYGTLITPIEAVRAMAAIANKGKIIRPTIILEDESEPVVRVVEFRNEDWVVIHEGMRLGVTAGTSVGLNVPYTKVAAKTGTAEVGSAKKYVHSWSTGFFPYDNPRYAFAVVMEKGPADNPVGATAAVRQVLDWASTYSPQYLK